MSKTLGLAFIAIALSVPAIARADSPWVWKTMKECALYLRDEHAAGKGPLQPWYDRCENMLQKERSERAANSAKSSSAKTARPAAPTR